MRKNLRHLRNLWDFFHSQGVSFLRGIIFVPQISQIYTDFFHHRMTRNLFGDFLLRRLFTEFRGGDLFGRCRYPLR